MKRLMLALLLITALLIALTACGSDEPTPTPAPTFTSATEPATNTPPPLPPPTNTPVVVAPTQTQAVAAASPEPAQTPLPTATPIPTVVIRVQDSAGQPIAGANVLLTNTATGFAATFATTTEGQAVFLGVDVTANTYLVEVTAPGFQSQSTEITVAGPTTEVSITLQSGVSAVTDILTNLRGGPGLTFPILEEIPAGETMAVVGIDQTGEWLSVVTAAGTEGWVFAELVTVQGDLGSIAGGGTAPPAPTVGPTATGGAAITPTATVTGTITPTPSVITGLPTRPAAVPFDATAMRAKMDDLEFILVQMGGLLDRVAQESSGDCTEYLGYYAQVAAMPVYSDVPEEWAGVYTEFQMVIDNVLSSNEPTAVYCLDGAVGQLSQFNYSLARTGIHDNISLLFAVQAAADELLSE